MVDMIQSSAKGTKRALIAIDDATNTIQIIDYEHHEIHAGSHFFFEKYVTLANEGVHILEITTPDTTKWVHFTFRVSTDLATKIDFVEGCAAGSGGEAATPLNNNRNSSNTSSVTMKTGVGAGAGGTTLISRHVGASGAGFFNPGDPGSAERNREIILKQNTIYQLRLTSEAADNIVDYSLNWYEHTDKN